MPSAQVVDVLSIEMPTQVGLTARVAEALKKAEVDITSLCAWESEGKATFQFTVDDVTRVFQAMDVEMTKRTAVQVTMPHRAGALQEVAEKVAQGGLNISHLYATASPGMDEAVVIMFTEDDARAAEIADRV
jgi:hypothetical protein